MMALARIPRIEGAPPEALVAVVAEREAPLALLTEDALDAANEITERLKTGIVAGNWLLGKHLHDVHSSGLWKARRATNGEQKHKTFAQYCRNEIGMGDANVYRLIEVALNWSQEDVARLGVEKLDLIMRSPAQAKAKLLDAAKSGATVRDIKEARSEAIKEYGGPGVTSWGVDGPQGTHGTNAGRGRADGTKRPAAPVKRDMVTMVEIEGTKSFPIYSLGAYKLGKQVPTKNVDDAVGFYALVNEVAVTIYFNRDADGNLVGKLTIKRQ